MDPILIVIICLAVIVGLVVAAIIAAIVLDVKGISIPALIAAKREKSAAQKKANKKAKGKPQSLQPLTLTAQAPAQAAPQSAAEPQPVEEEEEEPVVPQPAPRPVLPVEQSADEDGDVDEEDELTQIKAVTENGKTRYIVIKYSKSFLAKLIQADEETKAYYSILKNFMLSYKDVKNRVSWKRETFRSGRVVLARLRMRGKKLALELPLNPAEYDETKYHVEDLSHVKSCADLPCMYRIKNDRRARYAVELITRVMRENKIELAAESEKIDYAQQYPYETTEALLGKKLIKELTTEEAQSGEMFKPRKSVTVAEADVLIKDEVAVGLVQKAETPVVRLSSGKSKVGIINIDTLSQYFNDGETVTLEEIKKRVPGTNKSLTYVKVLARGTLDKSLTVYADNFSLQAVKMIVLTGGKAVKI